jgi:hypothetical protein
VTVFRLNIVFSGVDFDDDEVFDALAELPNVTWRSQGRYSFATAAVEAPSALKAADLVTRQITKLVPSAHPIRLDDDLVSIPDVAGRVGVTREAVRNWANGTRHGNFPLPRGVVGDGIKVWAWSDVSRWLRDNLALGDVEEFPTEHDVALINALFAADVADQRRVVSVAAVAVSQMAERFTAPVEARTSTTAMLSQVQWVSAGHYTDHSPAMPGGLGVAA